MTYISDALRRLVKERAGNCCEYCHINLDLSPYPPEIDHIIAEKHDGETTEDNLCLSCGFCNRNKGPDVGSYDRVTKTFVSLYNPRFDVWSDHFTLKDGRVEPLTPQGRVTVKILQFNDEDRIIERLFLIEKKLYPCLPPTNISE